MRTVATAREHAVPDADFSPDGNSLVFSRLATMDRTYSASASPAATSRASSRRPGHGEHQSNAEPDGRRYVFVSDQKPSRVVYYGRRWNEREVLTDYDFSRRTIGPTPIGRPTDV